MQNLNMPMMATSTYAGTAYTGLNDLGALNHQNQSTAFALMKARHDPFGRVDPAVETAQRQEKKLATPQRRLVKVIIVDPDENIPLGQCLLYSGDEKLTDATDQELFFEIDIKSLLDKHNEARVKVRDKKVKERDEFLEPAKIRDLKMVVVNIASF